MEVQSIGAEEEVITEDSETSVRSVEFPLFQVQSIEVDVEANEVQSVKPEVVVDNSEDVGQLLWSPEGLQSAQKEDPDIGFVYCLIESGVSKPA